MAVSAEAGLVELTVCDGVAVLRLNDPERRNALSKALSDDLALTVETALARGARALVLAAAPPVFCAGGSLDGLLNRAVPLADMYAGMERLAAAPVPTIAAVGGAAVGAGVNLPLACDVVLVSPEARFDPRFLDVGIHPGGGHLWRLAARTGAQGAAALVLCGDALTGEEAVARGLAWRCVPAAELEPLALRLAGRAAARDPELVRRAKATLTASLALDTAEEAAALELTAQRWSVERPGFAEGVRRVKAALRRGPDDRERR
ncbi:enoyl-CoA hydratase-related protein [Actinocorallia sp. A-T 12471]|uniref:enoyl-CoA hydratase-related protein n=1 Tax=Actinocorallia sp. A-T 12471 TaxID=3089813 RepID=UPI0029CCE291|nr:enoyl-CoA hydratase-related protein [Actinocorallia sp. A-T 12471]MDX6740955.1 enoyl-CoA hydratase-related protein [Actinocorallia sp. A-T 12471]